MLASGPLERVAMFLDVETGRRLRNLREFSEAIAAVLREDHHSGTGAAAISMSASAWQSQAIHAPANLMFVGATVQDV